MASVRIAQHLYGNVEAESSPTGRGGFQTLGYSLGALAPDDAASIEQRSAHAAPRGAPRRWLYYALPSEQWVVARSVPLAELDRFGRGGRFLVHSLVFDRSGLDRIRCSPFIVMDDQYFFAELEQALGQVDMASGGMPVVERPFEAVQDMERNAASDWPEAGLQTLALLGLRARALVDKRTPLAFVGSHEEILHALAATLYSVPKRLRAFCSFDTASQKGSSTGEHYWAVGAAELPCRPDAIVVDAGARRVLNAPAFDRCSTYERWFPVAASKDIATVSRLREDVYALSSWLDDADGDLPPALKAEQETLDSLEAVAPAQFGERLRASLTKGLGPHLAHRLLRTPLFTSRSTSELYAMLRFPPSLRALLHAVFQSYQRAGFTSPSSKELDELERAIKVENHPRLRFLHLSWTEKRKEMRHFLSETDAHSYLDCVTLALAHRTVEPCELIVPGRTRSFLQLCAAELDVASSSWPHIVSRVLATGDGRELEVLLSTVDQWEPAVVQRVLRRIGRKPEPPQSFRYQVERRAASLGIAPGARLPGLGLIARRAGGRPHPSSTGDLSVGKQEGRRRLTLRRRGRPQGGENARDH